MLIRTPFGRCGHTRCGHDRDVGVARGFEFSKSLPSNGRPSEAVGAARQIEERTPSENCSRDGAHPCRRQRTGAAFHSSDPAGQGTSRTSLVSNLGYVDKHITPMQ